MIRILLLLFVFKISTADEDCGVIPISKWSGMPSRREDLLPVPVDLVIVQHTVTQECATDSDCEEMVKRMQTYHIQSGFTDIGYSFLIGGNGKVYEGAGWTRVGAHTRGYNARSIGVAFIGDFRQKLPTKEALQAAQALFSCGVENKFLKEDYHMVGQRQLYTTISPGETLQNYIQSWPHWLDDVTHLST